jgi:hypothetical protein
MAPVAVPPITPQMVNPPPPLAVVNLSYSFIGNLGMEVIAEALFIDGSRRKRGHRVRLTGGL